MNKLNENPAVAVKRKSIQALIDYCLEKKIELTIKPKASGNAEEWHFEFNISDINTAILMGMFLRENKLELIGYSNTPSVVSTTTARSSKKSEVKENGASKEVPTASIDFHQEENLLIGMDN
jgi:hypothetical protein